MILLYDKQIALITPPKTASTTLLTTLCSYPYNGILCIGPSNDPSYYDQHSIILPPAAFGWKKIATVRHPLQRFISLWGHLARDQVLKFEKIASLEEFVNIISNKLHPFYFYQSNQNDILGSENYIYVHIENLVPELINVNILKSDTISLPNINAFNYESPSPNYKTVMTKDMIEKLRWWWEPDAERFGYEI